MSDTNNSAPPPASNQSNAHDLPYEKDANLPAPPASDSQNVNNPTTIEALYQQHIDDLQEQYDNTWCINFIKRWWLEDQIQYLKNAKESFSNNPHFTLDDAKKDINSCINWGSCW